MLTLFLEDVIAIVKHLKEAVIEVEGECPPKQSNGADFVVVKDLNGVFVELIGRRE